MYKGRLGRNINDLASALLGNMVKAIGVHAENQA
jgi:hypothetical protein